MTAATLPRITAERIVDMVFPEPSPYAEDPEAWVQEKLGEELWSKQREIVASVLSHRYTAVHSCHDSGKSYIASRIAAWWLDAHPPGEAFVVSTAPSQTQVEAILWREIGKAHRRGGLLGRITHGQVPMWKHGSEIIGYGRRPQDLASREEAMAAFQGIHARWVLVIVDEGGGIPKWLFDAVDTLATNEAARVLVIGNPDDPSSEFARLCAPGSGAHTIHISAADTPIFTGEAVSDELREVLLSPVWVEERKLKWGEGSPLYVSKVLGLFPEISDDTLLPPVQLKRAQELELPGIKLTRYGVDVARFGDDETCIYLNRSGRIRLELATHKQDTMQTAGHVHARVKPHNGAIPAIIDGDGLGGGVVDRCKEQGLNVADFRNGARAYDPERFENRRAEIYWNFKEMLEEDAIDLPPLGEDEELHAQLGSIKWTMTSRGKIRLESKEDMKKRGLPSPDRADACVMSTVNEGAWRSPLRDKHRRSKKTVTGDLLERTM